MQNTTLRVPFKGLLGIVLLWQTVCVTPTMGIARLFSQKQPLATRENIGVQLEVERYQPLATRENIGVPVVPEALLEELQLCKELELELELERYQQILKDYKDKLRGVRTEDYKLGNEFYYLDKGRLVYNMHIRMWYEPYDCYLSLLTIAVLLVKNPVPLLEALIKAGANVNHLEPSFVPLRSVLEFALISQNMLTIQCLLAHRVNAAVLSADAVFRYIREAEWEDDQKVSIVKQLIGKGLDINRLYDNPLLYNPTILPAHLWILEVSKVRENLSKKHPLYGHTPWED